MVQTPEDVVERLHRYARRLVRSATRTLVLYEAWSEMNTGAPHRDSLITSPVSKALGVMHQATMDSLILSLMRNLDPVGVRGLEQSGRVSYPVFISWIDQPGVLDLLIGDARSQPGAAPADAQEAAVRAAVQSMRDTLARLAAEDPNRIIRLRAVRDRALAHELELERPAALPIYEHLRTMTDEILTLAELATRIMAPTVLMWPKEEVRAEVGTLVRVLGERFPARG